MSPLTVLRKSLSYRKPWKVSSEHLRALDRGWWPLATSCAQVSERNIKYAWFSVRGNGHHESLRGGVRAVIPNNRHWSGNKPKDLLIDDRMEKSALRSSQSSFCRHQQNQSYHPEVPMSCWIRRTKAQRRHWAQKQYLRSTICLESSGRSRSKTRPRLWTSRQWGATWKGAKTPKFPWMLSIYSSSHT